MLTSYDFFVKVKCIKISEALITMLGRKQVFNEW